MGVVAAEEPSGRRNNLTLRLDHWRAAVSESLVAAVDRFDRLFGDERLDDDTPGTRIALTLGIRADAQEGARLETRLRLHLALPNLERRVKLIFEDEATAEVDPAAKNLTESFRESRPLTGLRLALEPYGQARLSLDGGLRWGGGPEAFVRSRLSLVTSRETWERRLTQSFGWFSDDGWAAKTEGRLTFRVGEERFLRSTTAVIWRETENGVTPLQSLDYLRAFGEGGGYRWTARAEWPETPACRRALWALEHARRRRLYRDWLFGEAIFGMDFAQERSYEANPYVALRIEMVFGHSAR